MAKTPQTRLVPIKQILGYATQNFREFVRDVAEDAVDLAKQNCPVDTGNLRDSIEFDEIEGPGNLPMPGARVFTQTGYGFYVEVGTSRMAAQPFLLPGILQSVENNKPGLR